MRDKFSYDDFILSVDADRREFVNGLHNELTGLGCKFTVKAAKSGFVASYTRDNRTIANYVFRKKGLIVRIYANHIISYMKVLDTLPDGMVREIREAPLCKRLVDPAACNPKCSMGFDFILTGERQQKCRNSAFLFLSCDEYDPFIKALLLSEAKACGK